MCHVLGQISDIQLIEAKKSLVKLESCLSTLRMNIENTKGDLNILLGWSANEPSLME